MITFIIPGDPTGQPRHKMSNIGGFSRPYLDDDNPVHGYKDRVRYAAKEAYGYGRDLVTGPLFVHAVFVMARPQKFNAKRFSQGRLWFNRKPDVDNFEKALYDAITGIIWLDDSQVCDSSSQKYYAAIGEQPHVEVTIKEIV